MPDKEFFEELKDALDLEMSNRSKLDQKANGLITMSGMIATLLMGFGIFLLRFLHPKYDLTIYVLGILVLGIILMLSTIILSLLSYGLKSYIAPLGHGIFFNGEIYNEEMVNKFRKAKPEIFYKRMMEEYLVSIKHSSEINKGKAMKLSLAQWIFLGGVAIIPIIVITVTLSMLVGHEVIILNLNQTDVLP